MDKNKLEKRQKIRRQELLNSVKEKIMNIIIVSSIIFVCFSTFLIMLIRTDNALNNFIDDGQNLRVIGLSFNENTINIEILGKQYEIVVKNK